MGGAAGGIPDQRSRNYFKRAQTKRCVRHDSRLHWVRRGEPERSATEKEWMETFMGTIGLGGPYKDEARYGVQGH